jgi:hypothetical protein
MLFKLTSICSIVFIVYTAKFEPRFRRFQTAILLDDCEALRESPALKTLFTDIWVVENLASDWGQQEGGWEGPYTSFKI